MAMPPAGLAAEGAPAEAEQAGDPHPQEDQWGSASRATDASAGSSLLRWCPNLGLCHTHNAGSNVWALVPEWWSARLSFRSTWPCGCRRHLVSRLFEATSRSAVVCHRLAVSLACALCLPLCVTVLSCEQDSELTLFVAVSEFYWLAMGLVWALDAMSPRSFTLCKVAVDLIRLRCKVLSCVHAAMLQSCRPPAPMCAAQGT